LTLELIKSTKTAYEKRIQEITDEIEIKKFKSKIRNINRDIETLKRKIESK
jgi:hypothetical protein